MIVWFIGAASAEADRSISDFKAASFKAGTGSIGVIAARKRRTRAGQNENMQFIQKI